MTYLKPPAVMRRILNPLASVLGGKRVATLVVPGRRSGQPRAVPVAPIDHDGARYVVSARGETEWVRNLRHSGRGELRNGGSSTAFVAEEVPTSARGPILAAYRKKQGAAVSSLFRKLPDDEDHPVFKIS